MTLFGPPEAIEITVRVGVVAGVDHIQLQVECHDAETRELLAMRSIPHRSRSQLGPELARALNYVVQLVVALENGTAIPTTTTQPD